MKLLALSGGKDSMACLYLLRETLDGAIYVDTGYAYPETRRMIAHAETLITVHVVRSDRDRQQRTWGLPADVVPVEWTMVGQQLTRPKAVMIQPYTQCCYENIAAPLMRKAKELGATEIVSGQRDDELHRAVSQSGDCVDGLTRTYPIASWTKAQVMDFLSQQMTIPAHYQIEHSSLDCYDCPAYHSTSKDRVAWTETQYPQYYVAYQRNRVQIARAIAEALT